MERELQDWHPRRSRQPVNLTGIAHWPDGSSGRVLVSNLSYDGCHVWTDHDLCAGEILNLTLPNKGNIEGQVRWVQGARAGVRFLVGAPAVDARRARLGI